MRGVSEPQVSTGKKDRMRAYAGVDRAALNVWPSLNRGISIIDMQ